VLVSGKGRIRPARDIACTKRAERPAAMAEHLRCRLADRLTFFR